MWPTPNRADHLANQSETLEAWEKRSAEKKKEGINLQFALRHAVQKNPTMWPTPTQDSATERTKKYSQGGKPLTVAVKEAEGGMNLEKIGKNGQMWPTPRAAIGMTMKLSQGMANLRHKKYLETEVAYQEKAPGGTLNPMWVEWLMGYPAGYTDLKD